VARSTVYHAIELDRFIGQAIEKKGFSVVEAVSYCHTYFGRQNQMGRATDMMRHIKEQSITRSQAAQLGEEGIEGKIVRGVFADRNIPEYTDLYDQVIAAAQAALTHEDRLHPGGSSSRDAEDATAEEAGAPMGEAE